MCNFVNVLKIIELYTLKGLKFYIRLKKQKKPPHVPLSQFDSIKFCHTCFIFSVFYYLFLWYLWNPDIILFLCILVCISKNMNIFLDNHSAIIDAYGTLVHILLIISVDLLELGSVEGSIVFCFICCGVFRPVLLELSYCLLTHSVILLDSVFPTSSVKQKLALKT